MFRCKLELNSTQINFPMEFLPIWTWNEHGWEFNSICCISIFLSGVSSVLSLDWKWITIKFNAVHFFPQEFRPPESNLETWMTNIRDLNEDRLWKLLQLSIRKAPRKIYPRPPVFSGMFVLHATTNHSCNHNCKVTSRIKVDVCPPHQSTPVTLATTIAKSLLELR